MNTPNTTNVFDLIYPIGSIYLSVSDVSPAALFGGSWERITFVKGRLKFGDGKGSAPFPSMVVVFKGAYTE